jgi:hypothetical protein
VSNEPILINRRFFLIGAAATLAATQLPFVPPRAVTALPMPHQFLRRQICEMWMGAELPVSLKNLPPYDGVMEMAVKRVGPGALPNHNIHTAAMNIRAGYRWSAMDLQDMWFVTPQSPIAIMAHIRDERYARLPIDIGLMCRDFIDEGPPIFVYENHRFVDGAASTTFNFFEADNSLEARLARESMARVEIASSASAWSDDYDELEYEEDDDGAPRIRDSFVSRVRHFLTHRS